MLGLGGAAVTLALTTPPAVEPPNLDAYDVDLIEVAAPPSVSCARGYSTVHSAVEVFDRPADVLGPSALNRAHVDLETAVCFAEEHYLGEGQARMAHFEIDERNGSAMWVIMGIDGEVVTVAAGI